LILPPDATYADFHTYVEDVRGPIGDDEMQELWEWRQKLLGIRIDTGRGYRSTLPEDEQHLTLREQEKKVISEAQAAGRTIERAPA